MRSDRVHCVQAGWRGAGISRAICVATIFSAPGAAVLRLQLPAEVLPHGAHTAHGARGCPNAVGKESRCGPSHFHVAETVNADAAPSRIRRLRAAVYLAVSRVLHRAARAARLKPLSLATDAIGPSFGSADPATGSYRSIPLHVIRSTSADEWVFGAACCR